jgi:murein DD-endopeptidase MepM/ murein hydrolase activator NlpD
MKFKGKSFTGSRIFNIISWAVTGVIVLSLLGFAYWKSPWLDTPQPEVLETLPTAEQQPSDAVALPAIEFSDSPDGISRKVYLQTNIPDRPQYNPIVYTVVRGDSVFGIADKFSLKPESLLASNFLVLKDDPHSLRVGQVLTIPPVDGVYYQWEEDDTLESIADEFDVEPEAILDWIGNQLDLTDPKVQPGAWVMIPGGSRDFVIPILQPTVYRSSSGGGSTTTTCKGGAVGSGFFQWPAANHYLSGNDFWSGHRAIDIAALEGVPVYASDSGVVVRADVGSYNSGYGNVIMIDHGNGFLTLYAHLSSVNVSLCQSVYAGQTIGAAGNTGNSLGAHLHFEIRT